MPEVGKCFFLLSSFDSSKSGTAILDNLLKTVQAPVVDMKTEIEAALARGEASDGTGRTGPAGFIIESDNVSLEVTSFSNKYFATNSHPPEHQAETQHGGGPPGSEPAHDPDYRNHQQGQDGEHEVSWIVMVDG